MFIVHQNLARVGILGLIRSLRAILAVSAIFICTGCWDITPEMRPKLTVHEVSYLQAQQKASLVLSEDGNGKLLPKAPKDADDPENIRRYLTAKFTENRYQCQAFFDKLTNIEQHTKMLRQTVGLAQAGTLATAPLAGVSDVVISAIGASLGFTVSGVDSYRAIYIISPDTGSVYELVSKAQDAFGSAALEALPETMSQAIQQGQKYSDLCTVKHIRRMVSEAVATGKTKIRREGAETKFLTEASLATRTLLGRAVSGTSSLPSDEAIVGIYWYAIKLPSEKVSLKPEIYEQLEGLVSNRLDAFGYDTRQNSAIRAASSPTCDPLKGADKVACTKIKGYLKSIDSAEQGRLSGRVSLLNSQTRDRIAAKIAEAKLQAEKDAESAISKALAKSKLLKEEYESSHCPSDYSQYAVSETKVYKRYQDDLEAINKTLLAAGAETKIKKVIQDIKNPVDQLMQGLDTSKVDDVKSRLKKTCDLIKKISVPLDPGKSDEKAISTMVKEEIKNKVKTPPLTRGGTGSQPSGVAIE